jgi:hypothetical protein
MWANFACLSLVHSSIWDSWPIPFFGYPRGLGQPVRLGARSAQSLTKQLRLALEPECLENPTATAREIPGEAADSIRDTQAPLFHTVNTVVVNSPG